MSKRDRAPARLPGFIATTSTQLAALLGASVAAVPLNEVRVPCPYPRSCVMCGGSGVHFVMREVERSPPIAATGWDNEKETV